MRRGREAVAAAGGRGTLGAVVVILGVLAVAGVPACGVAAPRPREPDAAVIANVAAPLLSTPPTVAERLRALAVSDDDYYRSVLYTWTTPTSIADLRASRRLLVATAGSGGGASPFNRALAVTAAHPGPGQAIAHALATDPALIRRRYAWPAPFATVMGVGPRRYGNALIRIELRPEAWIGRYDPGAPEPFAFVDVHGAPVASAVVLAAPARIAAIFHVRTERTQAVKFREYVICSEAMIASWSVATPAIRDELDAEIALLRELTSAFAWLRRTEILAAATPAWAHRPEEDDTSLAALWHAALAFDNPRYRPDPLRVAAVIAALEDYDGSGAPLIVEPTP